MKERLQRFMYGRYGLDQLGKLLQVVVLVLLIISLFFPPLASACIVLLIYQYFRVFSRNTTKRYAENQAYLNARGKITRWFSTRRTQFAQRKEYRFYHCPSCRQTLRVPRGKGKISISCPKCSKEFITKS